jgi:hypothetical protein
MPDMGKIFSPPNIRTQKDAGCWWHMPVILAVQETEIRRIAIQSQPGVIVRETLTRKYTTQKRTGRVAQVIQCLSSKPEALSSKPQYHQKKNNKTQKPKIKKTKKQRGEIPLASFKKLMAP